MAIVLLELYRVQLLEVGSRQKAVGNVSCQVIVATLNSFGFIVRRLQLVAGHSDCLLSLPTFGLTKFFVVRSWSLGIPIAYCPLPIAYYFNTVPPDSLSISFGYDGVQHCRTFSAHFDADLQMNGWYRIRNDKDDLPPRESFWQ